MEEQEKKKKIVSYLLSKKILVQPSFLQKLSNTQELEKIYLQVQSHQKPEEIILQSEQQPRIQVLFNYQAKSKKRTIQDFIDYYNARYKAIENILSNRQELNGLTSIGRLTGKQDRETVSVIGMIRDKQTTKNNNIILEVEDPTGVIKVLASKNKPEIHEIANNTTPDEVIGISGNTGKNIIFANSILLPEIPIITELKKAPDEAYVAVLADFHTGSKLFLEKQFKKFLSWIKGRTGSPEQIRLAQKIKYIFIIGDLVSGVGIHPRQENDLAIKDVYDQFQKITELLREIPSTIPIIICPGNHDPGRISEPQPPIPEEYAPELYKMKNVIMVSNPAMINIHATENFPGFNVLMYHGYSFDEYASEIPTIRASGGYDRGDLIMKFLLQRRHLAPSHTSTLHIPDPEQDPLVINTIPDFLFTGHLHRLSIANYRNITMVCASCWEDKTEFQEKTGHNPEPGRVPIINLQTRKIKVMRF